jgi:hypothetical protein
MAREHPTPDDGITDAEWIQAERDARTDRIVEAASRRLDEDGDEADRP